MSKFTFFKFKTLQDWFFCHSISATVLYDKPPDCFRRSNSEEIHSLMKELQEEYIVLEFFNSAKQPDTKSIPKDCVYVDHSLLTIKYQDVCKYQICKFFPIFKIFWKKKGNIALSKRKDAPILLVSSTSWTPDEDFSILLDGIIRYEELVSKSDEFDHFPQVLIFITGKGPLKSYYEQQIVTHNFKKTRIVTVWLSPENYPKLLGLCFFLLNFLFETED